MQVNFFKGENHTHASIDSWSSSLYCFDVFFCRPSHDAGPGAKGTRENLFELCSCPYALAQPTIIRIKAHHDDIVKLGLHAVPPGIKDNVIIASDAPEKVGKKSSAADLEKLTQSKAIIVPLEKSKTFDLLIPITAANGDDLGGGFVVMEVPYSKAANEGEALKIGMRIRDEVQSKIPSKAALYQ